ncbi:MAG: hypothetical protein P4L79_12040 [Legionella sp.]|uniref:hypothetical protein n=1 Tax=Legionella sp. TaxID=459 RepID=UPI002848D703|nr:hypothetical protein [Legionella sp.]
MKHFIKFGFILGLSISSKAFSSDPVQGIYFGLLGEISRTISNPSLNFNIGNNQFALSNTSPITLSPVGGGGGFSLGYRINTVRLEGQLLFNINNYGELKVGSCTLISPNVMGPEGICPATISNDQGIGLGFSGNTTGIYGMFNLFYDFLSSDPNTKMFPYIGVGVGGAIIKNKANFESNKYNALGSTFSKTVSTSNNGIAAQGIIGIGSNLDDFATLGIDIRYTSAFKPNNNNNNSSTTSASGSSNQLGIVTLNFTGTYALDKGSD